MPRGDGCAWWEQEHSQHRQHIGQQTPTTRGDTVSVEVEEPMPQPHDYPRDYIDPQYLDQVAATLKLDKERTFTAMHLQSGQAVLDVGCGPGGDMLALA